MQETYQIEDLLIGELVTVSSMGGYYGTMESKEGPFIFNKKGEKYSEIFTEEEYGIGPKPSSTTGGRDYKLSKNSEENTFGKTYIKESDNIINYLNEAELLEYKLILEENKRISKINDSRRKYEKDLMPIKKNICLTKKRLLEIYDMMKEKQILENFNRRKEEENLEKQYTKKK